MLQARVGKTPWPENPQRGKPVVRADHPNLRPCTKNVKYYPNLVNILPLLPESINHLNFPCS